MYMQQDLAGRQRHQRSNQRACPGAGRPSRAAHFAPWAGMRVVAAGLVATAVGLILVGCDVATSGGAEAPVGESEGQPDGRSALKVAVLTVRLQTVDQQVELPGRVVAMRSAEVRPQVSGLVRRRLFDEGSQVREGQLLYELDDAAYRAAHARAQAQMRKAEAAVRSLSRTVQRSAELLVIEGVSRQEHEDSESALAQAEAELASAQAALASAQVDLDHTRIRAPIGGRIGRALVTEGALVTQGQAVPMAQIVQLDPVMVDMVQPSQELLAWRRQGRARQQRQATPVDLQLEDGSRYPHAGELHLSEVNVDPAAGAVTLRARVPNPEGWLMPGMFVRAQLHQTQWPQSVLLPYAAVQRRPDGRHSVWVLGADQAVQERLVEVPAQLDGRWLVSGGLHEGEKVVVEGGRHVSSGQQVRSSPWRDAQVSDAMPASAPAKGS